MLRNPISGFDKVGKSSAAESDGGIRGKDESKLLGFRTDERTMLTRASAFASTLEAVRSHFKEVDRWSFSVDDGGRSFALYGGGSLVLFCRRWRSFVQADEKKLGARMGDKCGDAKLPFQGASILRSVLPDRIVLPYLKRGVGVWYRFQNRYLWKIVFPYYALTSFTSPPRHPKWR
jgi:hypothetical protein